VVQNTSVYQRSNEATKEWCNKQKHIGIRTLACKPAHAPTCLPSSLPADRSAGVPCLPAHRQANLPTGYSQTGRLKYDVETVWN